jgi:glycosyltransferase involved in cell wall biosynthesis
MNSPVVSVITPFYNTASYLAECIESVLAQSFVEFEYILVDNCSTDGSGEIAENYSRRDSRIRVIRRDKILTQVQNYNHALTLASARCKYIKVVQADDFIYPTCLEAMVRTFDQSDSIGLVSSYWLKGNQVRGSGFPHAVTWLSGQEMARMYLREGVWVFGSPTAVMYRAALLEHGVPFYDETQLHEDTDKCMQILTKWDFGFCHQMLSFSRADNESISSAVKSFQPNALDRYLMIERYASVFLDGQEARVLRNEARAYYYRALAQEVLRLRKAKFWKYHEDGLRTVGQSIDRLYLSFQVLKEALWLLANPGATVKSVLRFSKRRSK